MKKRGKDIKEVWEIGSLKGIWIGVRKDMEGEIKKIEEMKGKNVGVKEKGY